MNFCLDDGAALLDGPAAPLLPEKGRPKAGVVRGEEPATEIFSTFGASHSVKWRRYRFKSRKFTSDSAKSCKP